MAGKMGEKIFDFIKDNIGNKKLYLFIIILGIVTFLIFPYLDANYFYYKRINSRIEILSKVTELDENTIQKNELLQEEYNRILEEISTQSPNMINNLVIRDLNPRVRIGKFISAGLLCWALGIICIFIHFDKKIYKLIGFIFFVIIGMGIGLFATIIPNFINPWINYIAFPLLEVIALVLLLPQKKSNQKK